VVKNELMSKGLYPEMHVLNNIPVEVDMASLWSKAHIKPDSNDARDIQTVIESLRPEIKPKAVYQMSYIQAKHDNAVDINGIRFTSRVLRVNLNDVECVFPFIATCGTELEERSQQYDDVLYRYVLDLFKEQVLRQAVLYLRAYLQQTYLLSKIAMMNPGSLQDWPLTEQKPLFSLFGDVKSLIGVELTESFLMTPVKSVSGIIFPTEVTFENCQLCPRENCPGRRAPYNQTNWTTTYAHNLTTESISDN
jgi:hypothetical protein